MKHKIHIYGDPVLRQKAKPIKKVDESIRELAREMIEIMRVSDGCGLAAQQIGLTQSICVVELREEIDMDEKGVRFNPDVSMPMVLINPEIIDMSKKTDAMEEGCLSFPDIRGSITRPIEIVVRFVNENNEPQELRLKNFVARVVQHEVDHLNGVLFIDHMSPAKRFALSGRLKRMKRETEEELGFA